MKYLKAVTFVLGIMMFGATLKMELGGDSPSLAFICYGFFAVSMMISWSEVKGFLRDLKG